MIREKAARPLLLSALAGLLASVPAHGQDWWFRAGPVYRTGMELQVGGSSYVQDLGLHAAEPYQKDPWQAGRADETGDREYDDGFVYEDVATEDDGLTWYWGYEDDGQIDDSGDTIAFELGGGIRISRETLLDTPFQREDDLETMALDIMAGRLAREWRSADGRPGVRLDLCLGAQGAWNAHTRMNGTTYRERIIKERYVVRDLYEIEEGPLPPAPYEGDFYGPGALIPNEPFKRERVVVSRTTWEAANRIEMDLRLGVMQFWTGARLSLPVGGRLEIYVLPRAAIACADIEAERDEQFTAYYADGSTETLSSWHDRKSETEWLLGGGVAAGAEVRLGKDWFIGLQGGRDWFTDEAEVRIGPNLMTIDPGGYTIGAHAGRRI